MAFIPEATYKQTQKTKDWTVFEYQLYEVFKFSLNQIRNGFKKLTIRVQKRENRNKILRAWNFTDKNDMLDFREILPMNALRNEGYYLLIKQMKSEMDEKLFKNGITRFQIFTFLTMAN